MFVPMSSPRASWFPPCAFPMFVCLCHVPSCCCPCLHPSPVPNLPGCVYHWFHLCPVGSPCLVHLCLCLPRLDCSHLSLVIGCLCVIMPAVSSLPPFLSLCRLFPLSLSLSLSLLSLAICCVCVILPALSSLPPSLSLCRLFPLSLSLSLSLARSCGGVVLIRSEEHTSALH